MTTCALCQKRPDVERLCYRHLDELGRMLDPANTGSVFDPKRPDDPRVLPSIPALYGWLDMQFGRGGGQRHSGVFRSAPPGRLQVMALRDPRTRIDGAGPDDHEPAPPLSIPTVLGKIVDRVDRTDIDGRLEARPEPTMRAACAWLYARRDWLAAQDWVTDVWDALRALQGQLLGAWGDPRMAPLGPCVKRVDDDGRLDDNGRWSCGVLLYMPQQPPKSPDEAVRLPPVRCPGCDWTYLGAELVRLGRERELAQQQGVAS